MKLRLVGSSRRGGGLCAAAAAGAAHLRGSGSGKHVALGPRGLLVWKREVPISEAKGAEADLGCWAALEALQEPPGPRPVHFLFTSRGAVLASISTDLEGAALALPTALTYPSNL